MAKVSELPESPPEKKSLFDRCREIEISDIIRTNYHGIRYLSWADAWNRLKEFFPAAWFKVHEFDEEGSTNKVPYLRTKFGVWVRVSVGLDIASSVLQTESLPVMDGAGKAVIDCDARDINDNIKRCLVKAMALHGFGLSVYEKDDLYAKPQATNGTSSTPLTRPSSPTGTAPPAKDGEYRIPFGKFKEKALKDVPLEDLHSYVGWLRKDAEVKKKPFSREVEIFVRNVEILEQASKGLGLPLASSHATGDEPPPHDDLDLPF